MMKDVHCLCFAWQELMAAVPLVEVQATRTQRPSAGTSYPYVDITVGDTSAQRVVQLQLEQVLHHFPQHAPVCFFFPCGCSSLVAVCSSPGPGVVSRHRHASGKHDARAG